MAPTNDEMVRRDLKFPLNIIRKSGTSPTQASSGKASGGILATISVAHADANSRLSLVAEDMQNLEKKVIILL